MIAFRYTKTDGAEYLSHLDLLRHIERTLRARESRSTSPRASTRNRNFFEQPARAGD